MSTIKVDAIQNTSGVEQYLTKAWVNFNGTGTVAITGDGNVSSITDNGTGTYTVNFTTAMPDANYAVVYAGGPFRVRKNGTVGSGAYPFFTDASGGTPEDYSEIMLSVSR